jgi:tetratricopeptide (TPR) repeat protein
MWYHLADGRYIAEQKTFPTSFYYSFVDWPDSPGVHAWLFQLTIYFANEVVGYSALLALRAALVIACVALIVHLALTATGSDRSIDSRGKVLALGLLALTICLVLMPRTLQLRPHLVSYVAIALAILIFERRRFYWTLPLIAVAWVNLHGVEWIVGALIAGAYLTEVFYEWWLKADARFPWQVALIVLLAALSLTLYPTGLSVFLIPFEGVGEFGQFVAEMQPIPVSALISPSLPKLSLTAGSAPAFVGVLTVFVWVSLAVGHRLRLSHAIMSMGGLFLASKGIRFLPEWALLSLPMLCSFTLALADRCHPCFPPVTWLKLLLTGWIITMPAFALPSTKGDHGKLPFNRLGLPVGTATFLVNTNSKGKLHAPPNKSGYFAWTLYPEVKIFSDMKHSGMATFYNRFTLRSEYSLARILEEHNPDFFALDVGDSNGADQLARHARFRPVFTDDVFVLYADIERHPQFHQYVLSHVNPHSLTFNEADKFQARAELERIVTLDQASVRIRQKLWKQAMDAKDFPTAERYVQQLLATYPKDPVALFMLASIREQDGNCQESIKIFEGIYPLVSPESQRVIRRHQGNCYYLEKDFEKAFSSFQNGLNPFSDIVELEYLYQYAFVSVIAGHTEQARKMLQMLQFRSDPANLNLTQRAKDLLASIEAEDFE